MLKGISVRRGDSPKTPDGVGDEVSWTGEPSTASRKGSSPQRMRTPQAVGAQWRQA